MTPREQSAQISFRVSKGLQQQATLFQGLKSSRGDRDRVESEFLPDGVVVNAP